MRSDRRLRSPLVVLFGLLSMGGCEVHLDSMEDGLESLQVKLVNPPADRLGTPQEPVLFDRVTLDVDAFGSDGKRWTRDVDVDVYLSFSGNKVGRVSPCGTGDDTTPLTRLNLPGGSGRGLTVNLVKAFGAAALWLEEPKSFALGASPVIYFFEPKVADLNIPLDLNGPTATYCSPWNGRHVSVSRATGNGKLVVTSVFNNAYVLADTGANYDPRTDTGGYNHLYVFTFSRPPFGIEQGRVIDNFSGNFAKFNGFSELGFPLQQLSDLTAPLPPVYVTLSSDRADSRKLLKLAASTVQVTGKVCAINLRSEDWLRYNQFNLSVDPKAKNPCDSFSAFTVALPSKVFGGFDAPASIGKSITITGILKNSSGQNEACREANIVVNCSTTMDCETAAMDPKYASFPMCQDRLSNATCVEGTCRRGVFDFWTVQPREPNDLIF